MEPVLFQMEYWFFVWNLVTAVRLNVKLKLIKGLSFFFATRQIYLQLNHLDSI